MKQRSTGPLEVTLVSSVAGAGMRTTTIVINQLVPTLLALPSVLDLDNGLGEKKNAGDFGLLSGTTAPGSINGGENPGSMEPETPMRAMLAGGPTTGRSKYMMMSAFVLAVGFATCIL
jgi:hypothetical protein